VTTRTEALRTRVAELLAASRARSTALTDAVDEADLVAQHSPLMSPLVWDLAHIGSQEEIWLVRDVGGREPLRPEIDGLYDAFRHSRASRVALPLLAPTEARAYVAEVRDKALDALHRSPLRGRPLEHDAFAFGMIVQHEQQHGETMLATHQLRAGAPVLHAPPPPPGNPLPAAEVLVPAGEFEMGTSVEPWALDNERPAHVVDVPAFRIDTAPVTNAAYAAFVDAGGYDDPRWWTGRAGATASTPGWSRRRTGSTTGAAGTGAGSASSPRWCPTSRWCTSASTRRRPTPAGPGSGCPPRPSGRRPPGSTRPPAGRGASPGVTRTPAPSTPTSASATCSPPRRRLPGRGVAARGAPARGDVWEWCDSAFAPHPGFAVFPYPEYSQVFFGGDHRILRGGSFGTDPAACAARSATGTTRCAGRSSPGSGAPARRRRGTPDACAATWPTSAPRRPCRRSSSTRRTRCCASPSRPPTCAAGAPSTPTGSGRAGTPSPAATRRATAAPPRSGPTPPSPTWPGHDGDRGARGRPLGDGGTPVTATAAAPFAGGRWLFSHNGVVRGWPGSVADLAAVLPVVDLLTLDAPTDAALLWALVRHRLRAGDDPGAVLASVVTAVEAAAPGSRLNLLLTDGGCVWATAHDHALSVRVDASSALVASEPTDDHPDWTGGARPASRRGPPGPSTAPPHYGSPMSPRTPCSTSTSPTATPPPPCGPTPAPG
jgi:iron(II)-dependent oxidoreductase